MKMFCSEMVAIMLVSVVLLIHAAVATVEAEGNDFKSFKDFSATASKRPSMAQMQELLKRARTGDKISTVNAKEMLKMDRIGIQYCNWQEINSRHELCTKSVVDSDLSSYCDARFDELVHFCADNLVEVVQLEINLELLESAYKEYRDKAKYHVQSLESIRADLKEFFKKGGSWYNDGRSPPLCAKINRQFKAVKAILEYAGLDFLRMAKDKDLVKLFEIREFCRAIPANFNGADQESYTDGI